MRKILIGLAVLSLALSGCAIRDEVNETTAEIQAENSRQEHLALLDSLMSGKGWYGSGLDANGREIAHEEQADGSFAYLVEVGHNNRFCQPVFMMVRKATATTETKLEPKNWGFKIVRLQPEPKTQHLPTLDPVDGEILAKDLPAEWRVMDLDAATYKKQLEVITANPQGESQERIANLCKSKR
ncbi:MAG TPA: hypothetical protein VLA77_01935 [Candidatus Saccharimonadales bacterium]|nr:hypothetical protein [Candidatus Saccharimonadales bacterium]